MIGESIRKVMLETGYSYDRLGEKCGWHRNTIMRWVKGDSIPNAYAMLDMAQAMEVKVGKLYGEKDE